MSACLNRFERFNSRFARRILRNDENDHAHVLVNAFDLERCRQWIKLTKFARALDVQRVGIAIATQTRTPAAPADIRSFGVRCALRVPRTSDTGSSFLCSNGPVSLGLPILPAQTVSSVGLQPPRAFLSRTYCHPPAARSGSCMPGPFGELAPEPFLRATEIAGCMTGIRMRATELAGSKRSALTSSKSDDTHLRQRSQGFIRRQAPKATRAIAKRCSC